MTADHAKCLDELASNARRLLADAELVLAKGSHQTASSLAILAMEEAGKFFHIKWTVDDKQSGKRNAQKFPARGARAHQTKQAIATSFYAARVSIEATKEFVRKIGYPDDDQTIFNFLTALHLPNEKAAQALEKLVEFVADKMATDERSQLMRVAQMGGIDRIKQQGLYVDIDASGNVVSTPDTITCEHAKTWIKHARHVVSRLPSSDR